MNYVDVVLGLLVVVFGLSGLRQGLVVSALSFAGFVAGALLGLAVVPPALGDRAGARPGTVVVGLLILVALATVGQIAATLLARRLKARITWRPAQAVDTVGGGLVGVLAVLASAWLVGGAVLGAGVSALGDQVRDSRVLAAVDAVVPGGPQPVIDAFGGLLEATGFPDALDDVGIDQIVPVPPPDGDLVAFPGVLGARASTVTIRGSAVDCRRRLEGSGFVFAPERVMTNAHVVAGVPEPRVYLAGGRRGYRADVVWFDPDTDVAVLAVPGLRADPLAFGPDPRHGDAAVLLGYPGDGPLVLTPARVRGSVRAVGRDIYGTATVARKVLALRARVLPGNSGGPLIAADGHVVGVVFAASTEDPDTGYALAPTEVADAVAQGRRATAPVSSGRCV